MLSEAQRFHHDLTAEFGILAEDCSDEDEFLDVCVVLIRKFKKYKQDQLENIFSERVPTVNAFKKVLDVMVSNIEKVKEITINDRTFEE